MKIKHFKIKEHFCTVCNTGFGNNSNLLEHIAVKHMEFKDGKEWRANVTGMLILCFPTFCYSSNSHY